MTRQVIYIWTCLSILAFFSSLGLKAKDSFSVLNISTPKRTNAQLSFIIQFDTTGTGRAKITKEARPNFSFDVKYSHLTRSNILLSIKDSISPSASGTQLLFVTSQTTIDTIQGTYNVVIEKDPRYSASGSPKSIAEIDAISINVKYDNQLIDGATEITFEIDKNVQYNLGNEPYVKNLVAASEFKAVTLTTPGSTDKILLFKDKENKIENTEETQTLSSQAMDLVLFDIEGIDNQDAYSSTSNKPTDQKKGFQISSRFLNLLDPTTGAKRIEKNQNEEWSKIIPAKLEASQKTECFFIFPPASLKTNESYECIRCNFTDSAKTSADQAYLIESSSFSEGTNNVIKKFNSLDVSKGQIFENLENEHRYALLPLFSNKTIINYKKAKDPTSNTDNKIMCEIISAQTDFTLMDFLNSDNEVKKGDPRCFIVSAAYGSAFEPQVDIFRWLRDYVILKTSLGQKFMDFYYNNSEPVANFIATSEVLKFSVRTILWPFAIGLHVLKFLVEVPYFLLFLSFSFLAFFAFRNVFMKKT